MSSLLLWCDFNFFGGNVTIIAYCTLFLLVDLGLNAAVYAILYILDIFENFKKSFQVSSLENRKRERESVCNNDVHVQT